LPLLAILKMLFNVHSSPVYVKATSVSAHKSIIFQITKNPKKFMSILGLWEI
jgi:hypothetical protein